jgi:ankyrin repeat protein
MAMSGDRYYTHETLETMRQHPLERDAVDDERLKALRINTYAELEESEQIQARREAREEAYLEPKAKELASCFEDLGLDPLPPPLPKGLVEFYRPPYNEDAINTQVEPFTTACREGRLDLVKDWVEKHGDVLRQVGRQHGLAFATLGDQLDVVRYLLEEGGAHIDGAAIELACMNASLGMFEILVEHGYHPNQQIPSPMGRLGTALTNCLQSFEVIKFLLASGADPDLGPWRDTRCRPWGMRATPPLDRQSGIALDEAVKAGRLDIAELLLQHGAHANCSRPIHVLINSKAQDWRPFLDLLLRYGVNVNAGKAVSGGGLGGKTMYQPLHLAVKASMWDLVEFLLRHGADRHAMPQGHPRLRAVFENAFNSGQASKPKPAEETSHDATDDAARLKEIWERVSGGKGD